MSEKFLQLDELKASLGSLPSSKKIVFTNGCFDILHVGHVRYLKQAKNLGTLLVVGLNSDASVTRLKGENRPIYNQESRALILASMSFVSAVIVFEEDTPYELIKLVEPDVLVKGGDYSADEVVGADIVKAKGGRVEIVDLAEGYSTSELEEQIRQI